MSELIKVETKKKMSREGAAGVLRELADQLARHNNLEFEREATRFVVDVPDEVDVEVEIEIESDGGELEVEISW